MASAVLLLSQRIPTINQERIYIIRFIVCAKSTVQNFDDSFFRNSKGREQVSLRQKNKKTNGKIKKMKIMTDDLNLNLNVIKDYYYYCVSVVVVYSSSSKTIKIPVTFFFLVIY